jgi:hypothetical protein
MIIGRTYPTDYDLKTAVEAGGTIYLGPYSGSSGSPYDVHNTNSWNIPAGKSTTIIPATGLIQIYVKHVNNYFPITAQLGSSLILGGMTAEFDNRLEIYGDGKDGTANPNGVINCLGSVTMNRGVMIWDYRSNLEGIVWVHGSGLFVFNAGAVINNCRSTQYIIYRSTGDTNAHSINGGGTFWNNSSSSGDANWG